jgi:hypothetical protein
VTSEHFAGASPGIEVERNDTVFSVITGKIYGKSEMEINKKSP